MLTVNEIFFSIQGEGTRAGRPSAFLRLTGCPLRCVWCDTAYAFHEGRKRDEADVLEELRRFPTRLLCLTGGEPLSQPAAFPFVARVLDDGWEVAIETSGHVSTAALDPRACVILDVKAPGSGESHRMDWSNVDRLRASDEAKFVIDGRADYEWSRQVVRERRLAERATVLFSPVHGVLDGGELGRWILEDGLPVRLQLQLHKYLWPKETRGV
jgi:7-carboxy-7-deazaguanine synthase